MSEPTRATKLVGLVSVLGFIYLSYASMNPQRELTWPVIVGYVLLVAILLGRAEQLATVVEAWRHGGDDDGP